MYVVAPDKDSAGPQYCYVDAHISKPIQSDRRVHPYSVRLLYGPNTQDQIDSLSPKTKLLVITGNEVVAIGL